MAYTPTHHSEYNASRPGFLARFGAALSRGFAVWVEALSRRDRIEALQAKSDAELAAMGLRREDIVHHVFRDRAAF